MKKSFKVILLTILLVAGFGFFRGTDAKAAGTYMIKVNKQNIEIFYLNNIDL